LFALAVRVPDRDPFAVASGFTSTVQLALAASTVDPPTQVPPASTTKLDGADSVRPLAEDV
jgi:hypothetical protein